MSRKAPHAESKAGFVYVMSNQAMPGLVKIGMTRRNPEVRLREINSATGVLPFSLEAVISSRNARWTEREVHERLSGRRVKDNREFFRIGIEEARKVVFDVARSQRQRAYGASSWRRGFSAATAIVLASAILPVAWAMDPRLAGLWGIGCLAASVTGHPGFLREYLTMSVGRRGTAAMLAAGSGAAALLRPEWIGEAADLLLAAAQAH